MQNIIKKVANVLNTEKNSGMRNQRSAIRIKEKIQKAVRQKDYVRKLLETCKSWGGPCVTSNELIAAIDAKPGKQEQIVKTELTFYGNIYKSDMKARLDLFKLKKISHEERLDNLLVLLSDEDIACGSVADLPTNSDALKTLKNSTIETTPNNPPEIYFSVHDSYAVAWCLGAKWQWFLGYVKEEGEGETYLVEHLERVKTSNGMLWKYPATDDVTSVSAEQIVHVDVKGDLESKCKT